MLVVFISILMFVILIVFSITYDTPYERKHGNARMEYQYKNLVKEFLKYPNSEILYSSYSELKISAEIEKISIIFTLLERNFGIKEIELSIECKIIFDDCIVDKHSWYSPSNNDHKNISYDIHNYLNKKIAKCNNPNILVLPEDIFNYCKTISIKSPSCNTQNSDLLNKMKFTSLLYCCSMLFLNKKYLNEITLMKDNFLKRYLDLIIKEAKASNIEPINPELIEQHGRKIFDGSITNEFYCLLFLKNSSFLISYMEPYEKNGNNSSILSLTFNYYKYPGTFFILDHHNYDEEEKCNELYSFLSNVKKDFLLKLL